MKNIILTLSLLLVFAAGFAQTYLINEGFESTTFPPTGWTNSASGCIRTINNPKTGSACLGFNGFNDAIYTPQLANPNQLSFWYKRSSNTTAWTLNIQVSTDALTWNSIGTITNVSTTYQEFTYDLSSYANIYIRMLDQRPTGLAERYVDDFTVTAVTSAPSISVTPNTLSDFTYVHDNGPSNVQSFDVTGSNLTANLSVSVTSDYAIASSSGGIYSSSLSYTPSSGSVSATVFVRQIAGLAVGADYTGTVTCFSTPAADKIVSLSGEVTSATPPAAPVATAATNVGNNSFTANWSAVSNAHSYSLDVYTSTTGPTTLSEGFEGYSTATPPAGWTLSSTGSYILTTAANAHTGTNYAGMNLVNGWVRTPQITNPSTLSFWVRTSAATANFTAKVQTSPDGSNWTDQATYTATPTDAGTITSIYAQNTVNLNLTGNYYIRWFISARSGGSLYIDDVSVGNPAEGYSYILQNQEITIGTYYTVTGLAENTQYHYLVRAVNSFGTSDNSNIIDVATTSGSSAPTIQARDIIGYPGNSSISLEWTPGNGAYRIVKINTSNSFAAPANGNSPTANTFYTGAGEQVVFNGATEDIEGSPFDGCTVTNLAPNTAYWFRIYEYNGSGIDTKYLSITAANNPKSITTTSSSGSGYYANISGYGTTLKGLLNNLIQSSHTTEFSYEALKTQIRYTDEDPANSNNLIEIYTGWSVPKSSFGNGGTDWNREHTWSKSHGDFGDVAPAGTDLHHLRPCDVTVNSAKSNKDFDEGGNPYTDASPPSDYSGVTGCNQTTNTWEPRDEDKGDVARMIMYMAVRYEGAETNVPNLELVDHVYTDGNQHLPYYGKLGTLLQWHVQDPPDAWETRRNNRIAERQGNRNPFIDIPGYASRIWAPCPLNNTNITTTSFTGNWSVPITATNYWLQVATDSLFTNIVSGYSNHDVDLLTNKNISGLNAGGTYYYRLRSYFESDFSMWSPYLEVVLQSPVVESTATITLDGANIRITITPVAGAVSYIVYGSSDPYGTYLDISNAGTFGTEPENNVWTVPQSYFPENRYFFKVSAVR